MAYVKPGVEITQVQRSFSPSLIAPDLGAVLVAPAYKVVPHEGTDAYTYWQTFSASANTTVNISGLSALTSDLYLDGTSVFVDLVKTTGTVTGRIHLDNTQLTGPADGAISFVVGSGVLSGVVTTPSDWTGAQIRVGYRALRKDLTGFFTFEGLDDITNVFGGGQTLYDNPLPFSLSLALQNTSASVFGYALQADEFASLLGSGVSSTADAHTQAMSKLENYEVYAIAPYTQTNSILASYTVHCNSMSLPTEKHERIVFGSPEIKFYNSSDAPVTSTTVTVSKAATARKIRDEAAVILNKRTFFVRPHVVYFPVSQVPVQKLKPAYMNNIFNLTETYYAKLALPVTLTLSDSTTRYYTAGTEINDTVYAYLKDAQNAYKFDVLMPVPGSYLASCVVGQVSGVQPEQGHTNLPIAGPTEIKFGNDFFSESNLNTIAEGGNYQTINLAGSIVSRHQLSTNMNSVQERELNIIKTVDYVAKYIRSSLVGFIGRSLITPGFLSVVGAIINGLGSTLMKDGRLNGFKLNGVKQDEVQKDVVRVSLEIQPKYPVNYIKVDLIF